MFAISGLQKRGKMLYQPNLFEPPTRLLFPGMREAAPALLAARMPTQRHKIDQAAIDHGYRMLALEVLRLAVKDARRNGQKGLDARYWLEHDAPVWFEALGVGVRPGQYREWLQAGCPGLDPEGGEDA
jgi:hypothetical protein